MKSKCGSVISVSNSMKIDKLSVPREHKKIRSQGKFRNQNFVFVSSKIKVTVIIKVSFFPINKTKKTMISSPRKCASSSQSIFEKVEKKERLNIESSLCFMSFTITIIYRKASSLYSKPLSGRSHSSKCYIRAKGGGLYG